MRRSLLTTVALFGLACAVPAFAQSATSTSTDVGNQAAPAPDTTAPAAPADQATTGSVAPAPMHHHWHHAAQTADSSNGAWAHQPGTGESGPASSMASNIDPADTHSDIAPHFPAPKIGQSGTPEEYLKVAEHALANHQTGEAQQALEMAETRLLDRSTPVDAAGHPDANPMVASVSQARDALGHKDWAGARKDIQTALASEPSPATSASPAMTAPAPMSTGK
jgi:hypothetical protein